MFVYIQGAQMVVGTAPARRAAFFFEHPETKTLTTAGWALFDAAVQWTSGR